MPATMTPDQKRVNELRWFHSIDFGNYASQGRFPRGKPQNITLYGTFELLSSLHLQGASVLDIGTYDGLVAFGTKELGVSRMVAVDTFENPAFLLSRELLGYSSDDIDYRPGLQVAALPQHFGGPSFDVIACCGIIYHMLRPMEAFTECRKLLRKGGMLILETPYDATRDDAVLVYNPIARLVNEPLTYFVPTHSALVGMAQLAGFRVLATRILKSPRRVTLLLQAVGRDTLIADPQTPPFLVQMLKRDTCDDGFRYRDLEKAEVQCKLDLYDPARIAAFREIDVATESPQFPYHPPLDRPVFGATRYETVDGNTKVL